MRGDTDDLKFKEYELARRVGLENVVGSSSARDVEEEGRENGVGKVTTLRQLGGETPGTIKSLLRRQTSLGQFSKPAFGGNKADIAKKPKTQSYDVSHQVPLWFEKICELDGVTEAESLIVQNEVMHNETQLMRLWSQEARGLITIKAEESELRDLSELEELQVRNDELEKESIVSWLGVEALASVINFNERKQLMSRSKTLRISGEQELLQQLENKRREIIYGYYRRSNVRNAELETTLSEGPKMLQQFGHMLESACNNMIQNNKSKLLEELHKKGVEVGRLRATDATSKLHRKILLNSMDKSVNIHLMHGDLTLTMRPSRFREWGYVHATDGPWRVRRYDRELVKEVTKDALNQVLLDHTTSTDALRNLAKVIDAIQVDDAKIHEQVIDAPYRARDILQQRLSALGINFDVMGASSLGKLKGEIEVKQAVKQVIQKINDRLEFYGRFYFEIHAHNVSVVDVPPVPLEDDQMGAVVEEEQENQTNIGQSTLNPLFDVNEEDEKTNKDKQSPEYNFHDGFDDEDEMANYEEPEFGDVWMIGLSLNTLKANKFPGSNEHSFGLRSDGTTWFNGKPKRFCSDLSNEMVVGILLDMNVGSISVFAGGVLLGVAFGVDATAYSKEEQIHQGELIRTQHLIPAFALKSDPILDSWDEDEGNVEERKEGSVVEGNEDINADNHHHSRHPHKSESKEQDDYEDDWGDIDIAMDEEEEEHMFNNHNKYSMAASLKSQQQQRRQQTKVTNIIGEHEQEHSTAVEQPDFDHDDTDETDVQVPAITINFGGYKFSRLPPHALSCDSYLSFATESKQAEEKRIFEETYRSKLQQKAMEEASRNQNSNNNDMDQDNHDSDDDDEDEDEDDSNKNKNHNVPGSFKDMVDMDVGSKNVILEYRKRLAFFDGMQYKLPTSWSNFPPRAHRVGYSANTLQRAIRRFLGRKFRQRELLAQTLAITLLQRKIREVLPRLKQRKITAATNIQRVFRGFCARKRVRLAISFATSPETMNDAAIKVQSTIRRKQAANKMKRAMQQAEQQVNTLIHSAQKIQIKWRKHLAVKETERMMRITGYVQVIQKLWRGLAERRKLADNIGDEKISRLQNLGQSIIDRKVKIKAVATIQRIWRGKADRTYADMRRMAYYNSAIVIQRTWASYRIKTVIDCQYDAGPAFAIKKFLLVCGVINI